MDEMHCGFIVISGWKSSGCNSLIIKVAFCMLLMKWDCCVCVCSCVLIMTETFSNFQCFPVVLLFALKVCVPCGGFHKCNFQQSSPLSTRLLSPVAVSFLHHHIPPISTALHGFTVLAVWI